MLRPQMRRYRLATLVAVVFLAVSAQPAAAGPAKYDPKTRSFSLTYTYASLPHFGMRPQEVETLGSPQEPTREQDEAVRALHQAVSQVLSEITEGRAKIGTLEYVKNIKAADIVISMTGNFNRAGWAISGAIEGRPGQVGLYYLYLSSPDRARQDVVLTVAHELGHYLFSLPDEYSSNASTASCPLKNPTGPGCLMDNYMTRHGFLALCTDNDHNANGPRQNPGTIVESSNEAVSCQKLVDRFFETHPPGSAPESTPDADDPAPAAAEPVRVAGDLPFSGRFKRLVESTISYVREKADLDAAEKAKSGKKVRGRETVAAGVSEVSALRKWADARLKEQLEAMRNDADFVPPTKDQIKQAIELIVQKASERSVERPASLNRDVVTLLKSKAKEFASKQLTSLGGRTTTASNLVRLLLGDPAESEKQIKPAVDKVKKELISFLLTYGRRALIGFSPSAGKPSAEEQRFIEQIAREAVRGTTEPSDFATYFEAAKLHIRLSENASQTLNALASELNLPGAENRRLALSDLQAQLERFALPGKPFTGFGYRRTIIVAPHPLNPEQDTVPVDAGDKIPYQDIRNLAVTQFMGLIQRERTVFFDDDSIPQAAGPFGPPAATPMLAPAAAGREMDSGRRFARHVALINALAEEVRADRVENIIIMAPPGGLTQETGDALETLRRRVLGNRGVRVDLITLAASSVPLRLRDLVHKSGGTMQSAIDIDETGMISQRLKNDLSAGSWVSLPEQGYIDLSPINEREKGTKAPRALGSVASLDDIQDRYLREDQGNPVARRERNGGLDPIFKLATEDLERFLERATLLLEGNSKNPQFLPKSYDTGVRETMSRLYTIKNNIDRLNDALAGVEAPGRSLEQRLMLLQVGLQDTKTLLRTVLNSGPLFPSPLMDTDDYLDFALRRRLLSRAEQLAASVPESGHGRYSTFPDELRSSLLRRASYLIRRATERDQRLADVQRSIYRNEVAIRGLGSQGRVLTEANKARIKQLSADNLLLATREEDLEHSSIESIPQAPKYLLRSAEMLGLAVRAITARDDETTRWSGMKASTIAESLAREAALLERASRLGVSSNDFANHVSAFRRRVARLTGALTPAAAGEARPATEAVAKLEQVKASLDLLSKRSELMISTSKPLAPSRAEAEGEEGFMSENQPNAMSSLLESLKSEVEIEHATKLGWTDAPTITGDVAPNDQAKSKSLDLFPYLEYATAPTGAGEAQSRRDSESQRRVYAKIVRFYAEDLVYGEFPRLLLDLLGHFRMIEDDLASARERIFDTKLWRSPSDRLGDRRDRAKIDLNPFRDGEMIQVSFRPFQAEREADYEIVLGLTRPLRSFEALKQDPPKLELFRDVALEEKPYLNFVEEVSTPTMLVFRAPKPVLQAGVIGEGLYTPRLQMRRRYFPIVGRDNTISYTFTVATTRPSVQLIAALRQPQPKDGEFDPTKDPESAFRGTIPANQNEAIIEVQVLAGASVRNAEVKGVYQRFDTSNEPIETPSLNFVDDGIYPDLNTNDGVYTARVTLQPSTRRRAAEYRVLIQARPTNEVAFIPLAEKMPQKEGTEKADLSTTPPRVPAFQRATSLNFRVAGEN